MVTIGVQKIELAPVLPTGGPGTAFATMGNTLEDSLQITPEDGNSVTVPIEESEDPIYEKETRGTTTIEWIIPDPELTAYEKLEGGTIDGNKYSSPDQLKNSEWTVKVTPEVGFINTYNRVKITAVEEGSWGRNNALGLRVRGRILQPTLAGTPRRTKEAKA